MISQKRSPRMKDGVEVTTYNYSYRDDGTLESSTENTHQKEGNKDYERYWSYDEHGNLIKEDIQGLKKSSDSWTKFYEYESMIVEVP